MAKKSVTLLVSPYAYSKILYMLDAGRTEVGGFGILTDKEDWLYMGDFFTVKQRCTSGTVKFDDEAVADFAEDMVDADLDPWQFMRVWVHTHPGFSPTPSGVDEETFARAFGEADWAIMLILSADFKHYARMRLRLKSGDDVEIPIDMKVDYMKEFDAADFTAWKAEYDENVTESWAYSNYARHNTSRYYQDDKPAKHNFKKGDQVTLSQTAVRAWSKMKIHGCDGDGVVLHVGEWDKPITVRWANGELNYYDPWALKKKVLAIAAPANEKECSGDFQDGKSGNEKDADATQELAFKDIRKALNDKKKVKPRKGKAASKNGGDK